MVLFDALPDDSSPDTSFSNSNDSRLVTYPMAGRGDVPVPISQSEYNSIWQPLQASIPASCKLSHASLLAPGILWQNLLSRNLSRSEWITLTRESAPITANAIVEHKKVERVTVIAQVTLSMATFFLLYRQYPRTILGRPVHPAGRALTLILGSWASPMLAQTYKYAQLRLQNGAKMERVYEREELREMNEYRLGLEKKGHPRPLVSASLMTSTLGTAIGLEMLEARGEYERKMAMAKGGQEQELGQEQEQAWQMSGETNDFREANDFSRTSDYAKTNTYNPEPTSSSNPTDDFFDDASPTAGASPHEPNQVAGSWDRLRQQALQKKQGQERSWDQVRQESGRGNASQGKEDSFSFSNSDEERQLAKAQAQREFDERVERERQGRDFRESGSGRWGR